MDSKSILTSKTIWGLLIAVVAPLLAKHGISIDAGGFADDLVQVVGLLIALWGRVTARGPLVQPASQGPDVSPHS